jgi:hypothetical protein
MKIECIAMRAKLSIVLVLAFGALTASCGSYIGGVKGNDTGGIISWSPENAAAARAMAEGHCAYYGKVARITGTARRYGDYISFACL